MRIKTILPIMTAVLALGACDSATGPNASPNLSIGFAAVPTTAADALPAGTGVAADSMTVTGANGTLTIDGIYVIVDKFKLEGGDGACANVNDDDEDDSEFDDCEEFRSPPMLVQIPVDGSEVNVLDTDIPVGVYTGLEWEVEDMELDEGENAAELDAVMAAIDSVFGPGVWPGAASMAVQGSFLPTDSTNAQPFTVFFDAEIEVEVPIEPPLEITADSASRDLTINLAPQAWFTLSNGDVMDLSAMTGSVVEFELEFEHGISSVEQHEHDDHEGGED